MTDTSERGLNMKYENVISLQDDLDKLIEKHSQLIVKNDFGSALNVVKNIDILTEQLKKIDYETMVSKYTLVKDNDKEINKKVISIWKQNAFGDIKDHEIYYLGEKYENNTYDFLSNLSKSWNTMSDEMKESVYKMIGVKDKPIIEKIINGYSDSDNKWYDVLKFFVETKQSQLIDLICKDKDAEIKHRGTGKTTALLRLSNDYNIPILVKNYEREHNNLGKLANKLGLHIFVVDLKMLTMSQCEKYDVLLIDEMTKFDFNADDQYGREGILNNRILIGFKNNL